MKGSTRQPSRRQHRAGYTGYPPSAPAWYAPRRRWITLRRTLLPQPARLESQAENRPSKRGKSKSILIEQGHLQLDLFDERNLLELSSPDYPGERLVACRNPELAKLRTHKREELLAATAANLEKIKARVDAGKLAGRDEIGLRVGQVINQYKVAKHFGLDNGEAAFTFARRHDSIAAEAALDGIYIIRTSVSATQMDSADCVRHYKSLANVERALRSLKTID